MVGEYSNEEIYFEGEFALWTTSDTDLIDRIFYAQLPRVIRRLIEKSNISDSQRRIINWRLQHMDKDFYYMAEAFGISRDQASSRWFSACRSLAHGPSGKGLAELWQSA